MRLPQVRPLRVRLDVFDVAEAIIARSQRPLMVQRNIWRHDSAIIPASSPPAPVLVTADTKRELTTAA